MRSQSPQGRRNRHGRLVRDHRVGRTSPVRVELLEPRLLLAIGAIGNVPPSIHGPAHPLGEDGADYFLGFTASSLTATEGTGSVQLSIRLATPPDKPLLNDLLVDVTSSIPGALEDNPFYHWNDLPRIRFPAGSTTSIQSIGLSIIDDQVVRGNRLIPFGLQVEPSGPGTQAVVAGFEHLELILRGNDTVDVVMNGRAPAIPGSVGSLRARVREMPLSAELQWASKDTPLGLTYTELIPAASFGLTPEGGVNEPARLEFTFSNTGIDYVGDVLLSGINRGVVDALQTGRRLRYLVDDDVQIPCGEPTHADMEVFAKGVAYDTTLAVGMQIVGYGYRVDRLFDHAMTGFQAAGLTCGTSAPPVLAVRGTEPNESLGLDLLDDLNPLGIGWDQFTNNIASVRMWLDSVRTATTQIPSITGHSLGGGLTQLIASDYTSSSATRRLRDIVTFNSPGISSAMANAFRAARVVGGVRHYVASGDIITLAGERYIAGGYTMAELTFGGIVDQLNPLNKHSKPMLADVVGPHRKPTVLLKPYNSVAWLSSPFFAYSTIDHYAVIGILGGILGIAGTIPCAAGPVFCHPELGAIPLVLVFRGSTEASRKLLGFYTTGIRVLLQNLQPIYQQYQQTGMFEARLPNIELKEPFLGLLAVRATDLKIKASNTGPYRVVIQGNGQLDALLKVRANFSGNNFVGISDTGLDMVGTISLDTITLVGPDLWQITDSVLTINTVQRRVDITSTVLYGPQVSFSLPLLGSYSGRLLRQTISGVLTPNFLRGSGQVSVLGGAATADATLELNIPRKELSVRGVFDILSGTVTATSVARGDTDLNLVIGGNGTVRVPAGIKGIGGKTLANSSGKLEYNYATGVVCASGWGVVPGVSLVYTVRAGFRLCSNSVFPTILGILGGPPIPSLPRPGGGIDDEGPDGGSLSRSFAIPSGLPAAAITFAWENSSPSVPIQVRAPDGTVYDEAAIAMHPDLELITELGSDKYKLLVMNAPTAGTWTATIPDVSDLGVAAIEAIAANSEPTISLDFPLLDAVGAMPTIGFSAADMDSGASVSLFMDDDRIGFDGLLIAEGLAELDGPSTYSWDTSQVPPGSYYVYGVIDDGINPIVLSNYSLGRVIVSASSGPASVSNVVASWGGGDAIHLSWPAATGAQFYVIDYTSDAAGETYESSRSTLGTETNLTLNGLIPGETYRFRVTTIDEDLLSANPSPPVIAIVGAFPAIPPGPGEWEVFADPGTSFTGGIVLGVGDVATLLVAPTGSSLSLAGEFSWPVPLNQVGFSEVVIRVDHGDGTSDVERRTVYSQPNRFGAISGQVFSDQDADGVRDALEPGFNGFSVELLDPSDGSVLDARISSDRNPGGTNDPIADVGIFAFDNLSPGTYQLRIASLAGFDPTDPEEGETISIQVMAGISSSTFLGQHDIAPPTVLGSSYLAGVPLVSGSEFRVQFSENVADSLSAGDLHLIYQTTMLPVSDMIMSLAFDPLTNTATWTFPGAPGGILLAGSYAVMLSGIDIEDASGNLLDGDGNGAPGGDFLTSFDQPMGKIASIPFEPKQDRPWTGFSTSRRHEFERLVDRMFSEFEFALAGG